MNKINFTGRERFPLSIQTMDFLQTMIKNNSMFAYIGGDNYILYGCEDSGLSVTNGYVVINGELLEFKGGVKQTYIYIKETKRSITASGYNFTEVYTSRTAEFGISENQIAWASLKRIPTNFDLQKAIDDIEEKLKSLQGIPIGVRVSWPCRLDAIPKGYLFCDGSIQTKAEYPELYEVLKNMYGHNSATTFRLPPMGGRFPVGHTLDDDNYNEIGKTGGAKEVALKVNQMPAHTHFFEGSNFKAGSNPETDYNYQIADIKEKKQTESTGSGDPHENRPPYITEAFIIKAKY